MKKRNFTKYILLKWILTICFSFSFYSCGENQTTSRIKRRPTPNSRSQGNNTLFTTTTGGRPRLPGEIIGTPLDSNSQANIKGTYRKTNTFCGTEGTQQTDFADRMDLGSGDPEMAVRIEMTGSTFRQVYSNTFNACTLTLSYIIQSITDRVLSLTNGKARVTNSSEGLSLKDCNLYFEGGSSESSEDTTDSGGLSILSEIEYEYFFDSRAKQLIIVWGYDGYCSSNQEAVKENDKLYNIDHDYYKKTQ